MAGLTTQTRNIGGVTQQCISGFVNLFQFFTVPSPGSIIGNIRLTSGQTVSVIQTRPSPFGGPSLASVDRQFATLCGQFVRIGNQTVFDVRVVIPGAQPQPQPQPPVSNQLLLLLLLFILLSGRSGGLGQTANIGSLLNLLSSGNLQGANLTGLLGQLGLSQSDLSALASQLQGSI